MGYKPFGSLIGPAAGLKKGDFDDYKCQVTY